MLNNTRNWLACGLIAVAAIAFAGCPSARRITVEGYSDDMLNGKRVLVLVPEAADVKLTDPAGYAFIRGVATPSAQEQLQSDLQVRIATALGSLLDSNTVLSYSGQPIGGIVPLNAKTDFTTTGPASWDAIKRAGREGNVDYLIVLNGMTINSVGTASGDSGSEEITAHYYVLDAQRGKTVTSGDVSSEVKMPFTAAESFQHFAEELAGRMPFTAHATAAK
jgi:hypothetical protein